MCHTIGCFMRMSGHGHDIGSISELLALLGTMADKSDTKELSYEDTIKAWIADQDLNIRIAEVVKGLLQAEAPEPEAKLASLDILKPVDPSITGIVSLASYALASGGFLVLGTDHLTKETVAHTALNGHGLEGLQKSVLEEIKKLAVAASDKASDERAAAEAEAQGVADDLAPPSGLH